VSPLDLHYEVVRLLDVKHSRERDVDEAIVALDKAVADLEAAEQAMERALGVPPQLGPTMPPPTKAKPTGGGRSGITAAVEDALQIAREPADADLVCKVAGLPPERRKRVSIILSALVARGVARRVGKGLYVHSSSSPRPSPPTSESGDGS
jgi:hypothetical protein